MRSVSIDKRLIHRVGVREWGLPTLVMPGQIWRSRENQTISCMLANGRNRVKIQTRSLLIGEIGGRQWMPMDWRKAMWQYVKKWPASGCCLGPFLAIDDVKRNALLRKLGQILVDSDDIGAKGIANMIGQLAAYEFEPF